MYRIVPTAGLTARSRRLLVLGLLAAAAWVWLPSAATAGPNLVANGDLNHTNRAAKVRLGYGDRVAYFTFDGDAHFGRMVALASGSARTLKDDIRVAYRELSKDGSLPERGLVIDPGNSNDAGDVDISVWFDIEGKIRPDTEYEYTIVAVVAGAKTQAQSGFTLVAPAFWADGEAQGAEIEVAFSGHKHNVSGTVRTADFKHQTGPASMVLKLPPKFKDPLVILRMSLREVDRALIEGKVPPMPVPVR